MELRYLPKQTKAQKKRGLENGKKLLKSLRGYKSLEVTMSDVLGNSEEVYFFVKD